MVGLSVVQKWADAFHLKASTASHWLNKSGKLRFLALIDYSKTIGGNSWKGFAVTLVLL